MAARHWVVCGTLGAAFACGGGEAPTPPDYRERDRQVVDTDRATNATDSPPTDSQIGSDSDSPINASDPVFNVPPQGGAPSTGGRLGLPEPPPAGGTSATGGRGNAAGGRANATGGRGNTTGGRGSATGGRANVTGGRAGTPAPVPATCTVDQGCQCGDNLCAACECNYGPGAAICASDCG